LPGYCKNTVLSHFKDIRAGFSADFKKHNVKANYFALYQYYFKEIKEA